MLVVASPPTSSAYSFAFKSIAPCHAGGALHCNSGEVARFAEANVAPLRGDPVAAPVLQSGGNVRERRDENKFLASLELCPIMRNSHLIRKKLSSAGDMPKYLFYSQLSKLKAGVYLFAYLFVWCQN